MKKFILEHISVIESFDLVIYLMVAFLVLNVIFFFVNGLSFNQKSTFNSVVCCSTIYGLWGVIVIAATLPSNDNLVMPLFVSVVFHLAALAYGIKEMRVVNESDD